MEGKNAEPCLSCKVISVCCFLGIGGYLIHQGRLQKRSKYPLYALGTVVSALGIGEIFNKSPFR